MCYHQLVGIDEDPRESEVAIAKRLADRTILPWPNDWRDFVEDFDEDKMPTLTVLLLSFLPNLQVFTPPRAWEYINDQHDGDTETLDAIVLEANYNDLYAVDFKWPHGDTKSCLQRIELAACCIDTTGLDELVKHTPQLTSFAYSHASKREGAGQSWSPGEFISVLGTHCGDILRDLAITIDDLPDLPETGVTSMHEFKALLNLEVDVGVFAGPPIDSGARQGIGHEGEDSWDTSSTPTLSDILPAQIETLRLFVSASEDTAPERKSCTVLFQLLGGLSISKAAFGLVVTSDHVHDDWVKVQDILEAPGRPIIRTGLRRTRQADNRCGRRNLSGDSGVVLTSELSK
ncbi:hypothetical protein LTR86_011114 [Recurvomyces mirabilis]|nr:hypothetical protein LTR86_011114 [Recurvomyces mirabilis]